MSIEVFFETVRHAGPLLILAIIILCGVAFGELARLIRIPSITGQIVAGILLGKSGFDLFAEESLHGLAPLTNFALGLIAVTVGAHLNIKRLRNAGRRLFLLLLTESTITPSVVFLSLWMLADVPTSEALLYATVAIATAPAAIPSPARLTSGLSDAATPGAATSSRGAVLMSGPVVDPAMRLIRSESGGCVANAAFIACEKNM